MTESGRMFQKRLPITLVMFSLLLSYQAGTACVVAGVVLLISSTGARLALFRNNATTPGTATVKGSFTPDPARYGTAPHVAVRRCTVPCHIVLHRIRSERIFRLLDHTRQRFFYLHVQGAAEKYLI